ncbi:MAG: DUF58 domain-containing protein [Alphaproteobacteria bacterium]|nr:DUF58 domain-containing protein [Alphaproteobacteria bacterium]
MWSPSDISDALLRFFDRHRPLAAGQVSSSAIELHFDELVAMRGRRASFGRNQRIDGYRFGDLSSRRRGAGLELDSIGPYQWGDDIRHMDWFATARIGRPQVKQFRRDVQQTIMVVLDLRPSMMFGSSDQLMAKTACLAAAKVAWSTSKDHQPLGLLLIVGDRPAKLVPPRRGRRARLQHLARIADAYERAVARAGEPSPLLAEGLGGLPSHMGGDVEAVIISGFSQLGDGFDQRLRETGARGALSAIVVEDVLMRTPPPSGLYPLQSETDRKLAAVAIRRRDTNLYRMRAERHRRALTAHLLSLGMRQVLISDASSINEGYFR